MWAAFSALEGLTVNPTTPHVAVTNAASANDLTGDELNAPAVPLRGFVLPPTYLLSSSNAVIDAFRTDSDGRVHREFDRKAEAVINALTMRRPGLDTSRPAALMVSEGRAEPVPGAEAFLLAQYLRDAQIAALCRSGDPTADSHMEAARETRSDADEGSPARRATRRGRDGAAPHTNTHEEACAPPRERLRAGEPAADMRGMVQRLVPQPGAFNSSLRVHWSAATSRECGHEACSLYCTEEAVAYFGPHCPPKDALLVGTCFQLSSRRNCAAMADKSVGAEERFATFDGSRKLAVEGPPCDLELESRLRWATALIVRAISRQTGRDATGCTLHFKVSHDGELCFLMAQHVTYRAWGAAAVAVKGPAFRVPQRFNRPLESSRPGAASQRLNPEDTVIEPSINDIVRPNRRGGTARTRGSRDHTASPSSAAGSPEPRDTKSTLDGYGVGGDAGDVGRDFDVTAAGDAIANALLSEVLVSDDELSPPPAIRHASRQRPATVPVGRMRPGARPARTLRASPPLSPTTSDSAHFNRVSRTPVTLNEGPLSRQRLEGFDRRVAAESASRVAKLIDVMEGKRSASKQLAEELGLSRRELRYLNTPPPPQGVDARASATPTLAVSRNTQRGRLASKRRAPTPDFDVSSSIASRKRLFDPSTVRAARKEPVGRPAPLLRKSVASRVLRPPSSEGGPASRGSKAAVSASGATLNDTTRSRGAPTPLDPIAPPSSAGFENDVSLTGTPKSVATAATDFRELDGFALHEDLRSLASDNFSGDDELGNTVTTVRSPFSGVAGPQRAQTVVSGGGTSQTTRGSADSATRVRGLIKVATERAAPNDGDLANVAAQLTRVVAERHRQAFTSVPSDHKLRSKMECAGRGLETVCEFAEALPYQLESFFLAERRAASVVAGIERRVGGIDAGVPLGDRPAVLLFSVPPGIPPVLEKRLGAFLRSCSTWFGYVDAPEVRSMLRAADTHVKTLPDIALFAGHLPVEHGGDGDEASEAYGVLQPPPIAHLKALCDKFASQVAFRWFVAAAEEIATEAKAVRAQRNLA